MVNETIYGHTTGRAPRYPSSFYFPDAGNDESYGRS